MTTVFLTSASTSPFTRPGDWVEVGHTVELVGCGGIGATSTTGAGSTAAGGGSGGGYGLLTRTSGSTGTTVPFAVKTNNSTASQTTNATCWESTTSTNAYIAGPGQPGAAAASNVQAAAGNAASVSGSPTPVTYALTGAVAGGNGGFAGGGIAGSNAGAAGGAGGPAAAGGAGGGAATFNDGGGGGGAANNGATGNGQDPTAGTGGNGGTGVGPSHGGGIGSSNSTTPNGSDGIGGQGGGGGAGAGVSMSGFNGGPNGNVSNWVQTSDSSTAGAGGGGGGGGGWTTNTTANSNGGNGGSYGGGGGASGATRATGGTHTVGTGASGIIVIIYTPVVVVLPFNNIQAARAEQSYDSETTYPRSPFRDSDTLNALVMGGLPFSKQWRYDHDVEFPTKWQGAPIGSNTLDMLVRGGAPFANEWSSLYTVVPHPDWVGTPIHSVSLTIPVARPFTKQWRYDFEPDKYWVWEPPGSNTLDMLVMGGIPFTNEWAALVTTVPLPDWLGTPLRAEALIAPVAQPFSKLWRYDLNTELPQWQGTPTTNTLPSVFNPAFSKLWRYDLITDTFWVWAPPGSNTLDTLVEGGVPFTNEWSALYTVVPSPDWLGTPLNANALAIPKPQPFSKQWRYDYTPEPFWLGTPDYNQIPQQLAATFSKLWRYDYNSGETYWSWAPPGSNTLDVLAEGGEPFSKLWRYDFEPDKFWQGSPVPTNTEFFPFVKPFGKLWRYDLITDSWWQGAPTANPIPQQLASPFSKLWRYDWDSDVRTFNWPPQQAKALQNLTIGGSPFSKLWRWDFELDKFWQGSPTPTNLRFFPFLEPFGKLWRYDLITDTWWQGSPTSSNIETLPAFAPFSKLWRYDLITDTYWQRYSLPPNSLNMLTEGGRPFHQQWRYDYEADKFWQGSPIPVFPQNIPAPFVQTAILRAPLYAPRPEWDKVWQGAPIQTNIQSLPAPTLTIPKQWRYDWDSDVRLWQRYSWPSVTQNILVEGGRPFSKQWRYDFEPDKLWQGSPLSSNVEMIPPPSVTGVMLRPLLYVPRPEWDKEWVGRPLYAKSVYLPQVEPFSNEWVSQYTYDSDVRLWQRYSWPAISLNMLVEGGRPFSKQWRYDYEADKYWQGSPIQTNVRFFPFVAPFSKQWRYDFEADKYWQGSPLNARSAYIPFQEPPSNEWYSQYTYDSDTKLWQRYSWPAISLNMLVEGGKPTFKQWRYDLEFDKYWQGAPIQTNVRFFPFVSPFNNEWFSQTTYVHEYYWKGSPISSNIQVLPQVNPFFKQARFDYDSGQTYWAGNPTSAATLIILSQPKMFGQPGQGPTKQWRYDANFDTWWQGSPSALSPVFVTQFFGSPFQAPTKQWRYDYNQEFYWIAHITLNLPIERPPPVRAPIYAVGTFHRDDIIWWPTRQPNIALITSLLPKMVPSTFKWEHPPIETHWLGTPLSYPTPYMRVVAAIANPEDVIPSHVLFPRRKDPLSWLGDDRRKDPIPDDPLFPRRKDPLR